MKIGVIGAALREDSKPIGYWHVTHYQELGHEVVAVADIDLAGAGKLAAERNIDCIFSDYKEMLERFPEIEVVSISTPPLGRRKIIEDCLDAGAHLLIEKPLEASLEEAEKAYELVKTASLDNGLTCGMCFPWRFSQTAARIKEGVEKYGKMEAIQLLHHCPWTFDHGWRADAAQGGGELFEHNVHDVDLVRYIAGDVKSVFAKGRGRENGTFPFVHALLEFENGVTGSLVLKHGMRSDCDQKHQLECAVLYEDGALYSRWMGYDNFQESIWERGASEPEKLDYYWFGHKDIIGDFIVAIEEKRKPRATVRDGLQNIKVIEAVRESIRVGEEIVL